MIKRAEILNVNILKEEYERLKKIEKYARETKDVLQSANHQNYAWDALYYLELGFSYKWICPHGFEDEDDCPDCCH